MRAHNGKEMPAPRRLVSLTPSNTEILWALGLLPTVVGVDEDSDFPPEVKTIAKVGRDLQIDMERVNALNPDLVLASLSVPGMERVVENLKATGLPHIVLAPTSVEAIYRDIEEVGKATGTEARAAALIAEMKARFDRVRSLSAAIENRPKAYWEWWPRPLIVPGNKSWMTGMLEAAGGINMFRDIDHESRPVEERSVLERDPDFIFLCWVGALQPQMSVEKVKRRPGWDRLRAVKEGRIYLMDEGLYGRPGPRVVQGLELLHSILAGKTPAGDTQKALLAPLAVGGD